MSESGLVLVLEGMNRKSFSSRLSPATSPRLSCFTFTEIMAYNTNCLSCCAFVAKNYLRWGRNRKRDQGGETRSVKPSSKKKSYSVVSLAFSVSYKSVADTEAFSFPFSVDLLYLFLCVLYVQRSEFS